MSLVSDEAGTERAGDVDQRLLDSIGGLGVTQSILEMVCRTTGMGFATVARVTEGRWIACQVQDDIAFGLGPGGELPVETTLCNEVRGSREPIVIDDVGADPDYREHHTPRLYGLQSYIAVPITLEDGSFFGTLCAIDPKPHRLNTPEVRTTFALYADLLAKHIDALLRAARGEAVRERHAFLEGVLSATPDCVKVLSVDGRVEFMNARGVVLNQLESADVVLGMNFAEMWPEEERPKVRAAIVAAAQGRPASYEGFCPTAKDEPRWWDASFAPFQPDPHGPLKLIGVSRDITSRVSLETERRAAADALHELNRTLEARVTAEVGKRAKAEEALHQSQKLEAIGQLTGGVAHDFNNLLTVIRSSADLLRTRELPPERRRRYIDAISDTADRAAKLTSQLLAFSRRQVLKAEVFNAAGRVRSISDMLETVLGARVELVVASECDDDRCFIEADAGQFETALVNLAVNARDAMNGEGCLTITLSEENGIPAARGHAASAGAFVAVTVTDTGGGIPPDLLERIFEPFFTTKEVGRGTGLGLSQVFGFAKQSGGDVHVEGRSGEGARFRLFLPRAEAPGRMADIPAKTRLRGGGRVLVVEDNVQVGEFADHLLNDLGYETALAPNAATALALLGEDSGFDVLFSDVVMPGMSGVELARTVQQRWPSISVVLTSGYSHVLAEDARHGFKLLHKPYSVEELSRVLGEAAANPRDEAQPSRSA